MFFKNNTINISQKNNYYNFKSFSDTIEKISLTANSSLFSTIIILIIIPFIISFSTFTLIFITADNVKNYHL